MKSLVIVSLLSLVAVSATATSILIPQRDTRIIEYSVLSQGAKMSKKHIENFGAGTAEVNHFEQTVSLSLYEMNVCPAGMYCTQEIRGIFATLPIVERKTTGCNHVILKARQDMRPVDGILEEVTIEDYSNSTCKFVVPYIGKATYKTSFFNRMTGKSETHKSSFKVEITDIRSAVVPAESIFQLTGGQYIRGFEGMAMTSGELTIGEDHVRLFVRNIAVCNEGAPCRLGPAPSLELELPIIARDRTGCGELIVAELLLPGGDLHTLSIEDHSRSVCNIVVPNLVTAKFQLISPYSFQPIQEAVFNFDLFTVFHQ